MLVYRKGNIRNEKIVKGYMIRLRASVERRSEEL